MGGNLKEAAMHYCYILYSLKTDIFYIDTSGDPELALSLHNGEKVVSTKPHSPWKLAWQEAFATENEARDCARYLRSARGTEFNYKRLLDLTFGDGRRFGKNLTS